MSNNNFVKHMKALQFMQYNGQDLWLVRPLNSNQTKTRKELSLFSWRDHSSGSMMQPSGLLAQFMIQQYFIWIIINNSITTLTDLFRGDTEMTMSYGAILKKQRLRGVQ